MHTGSQAHSQVTQLPQRSLLSLLLTSPEYPLLPRPALWTVAGQLTDLRRAGGLDYRAVSR
jgi:hypothetical protein